MITEAIKRYKGITHLSKSTKLACNRVLSNVTEMGSEFSEDWVNDYISFLIDKEYTNSSIKNDLLIISAAMRDAGHDFDPKVTKLRDNYIEKAFLKPDEVEMLLNSEVSSERERQISDMLVLQAHTGMRWSDVLVASVESVREEPFPHLIYTAQKTGSTTKVPLSEVAMSIIKRNGHFPEVSSTMASYVLKKLMTGKISGTVKYVFYYGSEKVEKFYPRWAKLGSHSMRHSFAYMCKMKGIPQSIIADMMNISESTLNNNYRHSDADDNLNLSAKFLL